MRWLLQGVLIAMGCLLVIDRAPPPLSDEAIATRDALPEHVFEGVLSGEPTLLIAHGCEVYRVQRGTQEGVTWTSVLKPEFYPFFSSCVRQSLTFDGRAVTAVLGRQAFGAGGCCATGGTYRSVDGRRWKKL